MCLFTSARTVAIVFARSAGSEAMYCAGVLTFGGGFMDSSSSRTKCITGTFENQPAAVSEYLQKKNRWGFHGALGEEFPPICLPIFRGTPACRSALYFA